MRQLKITHSITNRDAKSIDQYMTEVSRRDLISAEEEVQLATRIQQGDEAALNKLVEANLRFVISVAKQYEGGHLKLGDLINEGNLGLIKAARKFDPSRGFKFISYAVWWIRQSIIQAISERDKMVRIPQNRLSLQRKIAYSASMLAQKLDREPTDEEIAEYTDIGLKEIIESYKIYNTSKHSSYDAPIQDDEETALSNFLEDKNSAKPDSALDLDSCQIEIDQLLKNTLKADEYKVVVSLFGLFGSEPRSLEDLGADMNLCRERIRQIKDKAIKKLKRGDNAALRAYLG